MDVTIERTPTGELVIEGLEAGKEIPLAYDLLGWMMELSEQGCLYPYRVHNAPIRYCEISELYWVTIIDYHDVWV